MNFARMIRTRAIHDSSRSAYSAGFKQSKFKPKVWELMENQKDIVSCSGTPHGAVGRRISGLYGGSMCEGMVILCTELY